MRHKIYLDMTTLRVKEICKDRGITLAELAKRMDISASALSQNLKKPSYETLEKLSMALKVDVPELFATSKSHINCPHCGKPIEITLGAK